MIKNILLLLFLCILSFQVKGEYRVYQYYVKSKYPSPFDNKSYMITTTLDPKSYVAYHGGRDSIQVDMLKTWTCPGHTGDKEICESPYKEAQKSSEAENN